MAVIWLIDNRYLSGTCWRNTGDPGDSKPSGLGQPGLGWREISMKCKPTERTSVISFLTHESGGYTHCLIRGPMSLPETLEMDLRKPWVDTSIWLHIWLWYFWDEAVLARLRSLLKTWWGEKSPFKIGGLWQLRPEEGEGRWPAA